MKRSILLCMAGVLCSLSVSAQTFAHGRSASYVWPEEPEVLKTLDEWRDLKFGMLIHWGLYAYWGTVESWSICAEEEEWIPRDSAIAYEDYKRKYWSAIDSLKPERFDPAAWAASGKQAGMKYVVFTTKHHDGFNMYDTKQSDFSIVHGAFKDDPRRNAAKEVFTAFREKGYMIGAYYSKPDWHSPYYWWDRYATPNRNNNYSIDKNPWRWNQFKQFTYNQLEEIVNGDYGQIDILWLDGGWVRPARPADKERAGRFYKGEQEIDMPKIAAMARRYQPGILIVERSVPGKFENYQTPERGIPAEQLDVPWESCITLGNDWGYVPTDLYKSPARIIHMLAEIVAKGGNFLLGIGPKPDGTLPEGVVARLEKIGEWVEKNGEAIYHTRTTPHYHDGNTWFTRSKEGKKLYAITCLEESEPLPATVRWTGNLPADGSRVFHVQTGKPVRWKRVGEGVEITVPKGLPAGQAAVAFSFTPVE